MALFSTISNGDNAHWMTTPNNSQGNSVSGSTSPTSSCSLGFDPAVGGSSSGSGDTSSSSSSSQYGLSVNTLYQTSTAGLGVKISREDQFYCKICKVDLSGLEPAKQHYAGKQHRKVLQAQEGVQSLGGSVLPLECKICLKKFTGQPSARQHFASNKHKTAEQGAKFWAQNQGQVGSVFSGTTNQMSPSGVTGLQPVAKEGVDIPTSPRAQNSSGVVVNDAAPDGALNQRQHQGRAPGASLNLGAPGGRQQMISGLSAEHFSSVISPGNEQLKQHIAKVCSSVLERYLMQLIPDLTDKITDKVIEELSKATPIDSSSKDAGARAPPGQDATAGETLPSVSTDYHSMPSLIEGLNSLDIGRAGKSTPVITNIRNDLSKDSPASYDDVWNSLKDKK